MSQLLEQSCFLEHQLESASEVNNWVYYISDGAKIKDAEDNVRIFSETNEAALSDDIEKVITSLGTIDTKYSKFGVQQLKNNQ